MSHSACVALCKLRLWQVPVDIAKGLEEHGLIDLFPLDAWPEMKPTVELASKLKLMRTRCGHDSVILFADLRKCVRS